MEIKRNRGRIPALVISVTSALVLFLPVLAFAVPARFAVGPDSNQSLLLKSIQSAQNELLINIYQIDTPAVVDAIIEKVRQGLAVNLLVEASPVGGQGHSEKQALNEIKRAMLYRGSNHQAIYMMGVQSRDEHRRFRFDHAKYVVIDGRRALISSENFTSTGHTESGKIGNRGWDTVIEDSSLAQKLTDLFHSDSDPQAGDIYEYETTESVATQFRNRPSQLREVQTFREKSGEVRETTLVTSPNSLDGITEVIRSARHRLRVEEMSLPLNWRDSQTSFQSPIVTELVRAADRGVQVQVLLNDEQVFNHHSQHNDANEARGNAQTVAYLKRIAREQNLPLEARIIDVNATQITYIHNKGIIVDDQAVFVSSINGTQNSVKNNREVAVLLQSRDAAAYFSPVFDFDWSHSGPNADDLMGAYHLLNLFNLRLGV